MKRPSKRRVGIPLLLCLALGLVSTPARAQAPAQAPAAAGPAGPVKVQVGVYLISVGKLDISASSYYMDFHLIFHCDRPCQPGNFEIMNGRGYSVEKQEDEPAYKVFRVKGELTTNMNLRSFPFDRHRLQILVEDKLVPDTGLQYVPDPQRTALHGDMVLAGWHIDPGRARGTVASVAYPVFSQSFSRYTFTVNLERPPLSAFLKGLLPALLIVLSGLLSMFMGPDKIAPRLTVATSALIASVLFHINQTSAIPPVGYMTFSDRFMMINYLVLLCCLGASILFMNLVDARQEARAQRLSRRSAWVGPPVWLLLQGVNAVLMALEMARERI
jgi:hypothetical protein